MAETRIVMGIMDEPFERDQEARIITMAAGALALIAAAGNKDGDVALAVAHAILDTDRGLSADAKAKLRQLSDELVASARAGKHFVALTGFRRG